MIKTKAPGKLMLSGEWSVLEEGKPCIVLAVNKHAECILEPHNKCFIISLPDYNLINLEAEYEKDKLRIRDVLTEEEKNKIRFVKNTIKVYMQFMEENANPIKNFKVTVTTWEMRAIINEKNINEESKIYEERKTIKSAFSTSVSLAAKVPAEPLRLENAGSEETAQSERSERACRRSVTCSGRFPTDKKAGLGSSAAVCVAVGAAIMKYYDYDITDRKIKDTIFKLSSIAHFISQDYQGSCFDVAASCYGGAIIYTRFSPIWLKNELMAKRPLLEIVDGDWPYLKVKLIAIPKKMRVLACWSGEESSTRGMMEKMERHRDEQFRQYLKLMDDIELVTLNLIDSIKNQNEEDIKKSISRNMLLLKLLGESSGIRMLADKHDKIISLAEENNGAAKISGAGGGDCYIGLCFDAVSEEAIKKAWKDNCLYPLDIDLDMYGVM